MKKSKKVLAVLLIVALAVCVVGTTLAWLKDETDTVQNTFAPSTVGLELEETGATDEDQDNVFTKNYKLVPGYVLAKDPTVTVEAGSEACWVFVEITKSSNLDTFITYAVADGWTALTGVNGVYYREVANSAADQPFSVLAGGTASFFDPAVEYSWGDNEVLVKPTVTEEMMDGLKVQGAVQPTLSFKAYAVQLMKDQNTKYTATEAWGLAK